MKDLDWEGSSRNRIAWCISIKCRELVLEDEKSTSVSKTAQSGSLNQRTRGKTKGMSESAYRGKAHLLGIHSRRSHNKLQVSSPQ